jgi:hypothetical protein
VLTSAIAAIPGKNLAALCVLVKSNAGFIDALETGLCSVNLAAVSTCGGGNRRFPLTRVLQRNPKRLHFGMIIGSFPIYDRNVAEMLGLGGILKAAADPALHPERASFLIQLLCRTGCPGVRRLQQAVSVRSPNSRELGEISAAGIVALRCASARDFTLSRFGDFRNGCIRLSALLGGPRLTENPCGIGKWFNAQRVMTAAPSGLTCRVDEALEHLRPTRTAS